MMSLTFGTTFGATELTFGVTFGVVDDTPPPTGDAIAFAIVDVELGSRDADVLAARHLGARANAFVLERADDGAESEVVAGGLEADIQLEDLS